MFTPNYLFSSVQFSHSVMSDSVRPHRWQPTRLPRPWDSPGKNTGVGCHFLLQCMKVKTESEVAQSCLTLSNPMDCSLPGSSVHGIFQARVLEWGAIAFSVIKYYTAIKFVVPWTVAHQTSLSMGFSRQEYWSGLPFPSPIHESESEVAQSCLTLSNPMDWSLPGSSVHGIFQARVLEWGAIGHWR